MTKFLPEVSNRYLVNYLAYYLAKQYTKLWMLLGLITGMLLLSPLYAAIDDAPTFANEAQYQQYNNLISIIRCPTCQNQNIAESNAALARQLRQIIVSKIHAGESSDAIVDYLVERYGDFITYDPPFKPITWLLWLGPMIAMLIALIYWFVWRRRFAENQHLSAQEYEELQAIIAKYK